MRRRVWVPDCLVAGWVYALQIAASDLPEILHMVAEGRLRPEKLIEREVSLEEGCEAIHAMDQGSPLGITMVIM